jgi:pyrroloquinoline quinone (PQQ) biosynthesis protein C
MSTTWRNGRADGPKRRSLTMVAEMTSMRRFSDIYPSIRARCDKYWHASKWYNLETVTPDLAKLWVQQMSIWTRTAFKIRGHVYANCPHPELRLKMLEIVGEEDVVDPRCGMNHRQLLATSFGKATGQTLEDLRQAKPLATTLITFEIFYGIANRSWEEGIAVASGQERVLRDSGFFRHEYHRLKRDLGWTEQDLAWFSGHDEADEDHGAIVELLDTYITDDRAWDRVEEAIIEAQLAWLYMFDGVVDAYPMGISPVSGASCKGLSFMY